MKHMVDYYRDIFKFELEHPGVTQKALIEYKERKLIKIIFYLSGKTLKNNYLRDEIIDLELAIEEYNRVINDKYKED